MIAYRNIIENSKVYPNLENNLYFQNNQKFHLSIYILVSQLPIIYITPFLQILIYKFGIKKTLFLSSLITLLCIPILSLLNVNFHWFLNLPYQVRELYGEKKRDLKSNPYFIQQVENIQLISYILVLLYLTTGRGIPNHHEKLPNLAIFHDQGQDLIHYVINANYSSFIVWWMNVISILFHIVTRLFLFTKLRNVSPFQLSSIILKLQLLSIFGCFMLNKKILLVICLTVYSMTQGLIMTLRNVKLPNMEN